MENLKITEKLSDGTQQELCISDVIGRLLQKAELLYGKTDDIEYKIEQYDDGYWAFDIFDLESNCIKSGMEFNSPTEAYEAAIEYVLTKLI